MYTRHRENRERRIPLRELQLPLRKNIRKFPRPDSRKKRSANSICTLSDTLTKSTYKENSPCMSTTTTSSAEPIQKPIVISPLKEFLDEPPRKIKPKAFKPEPVPCGKISLREEEKGQMQKFRKFKEKDVPLFTQDMTHIILNSPGCDNDCQTDDEQIRTAIGFIQREMNTVLVNYKERMKEVRNIGKYEGERVIAADKHRVY